MKTDIRESCQKHEIHEDGLFDDISLRPFHLSDIDDFMTWATDNEVTHYLPWSTYSSRKDGLDFIKNVAIPHPFCWVICLKNRPIGSISVTPSSGDGARRGQLGYALASKYWGKGITTTAVRMVVSAIFSEWPQFERLEALVDVANGASQRVLEKVGFKKEGVLRKYMIIKGTTVDTVMFSFLSTDFQTQKETI